MRGAERLAFHVARPDGNCADGLQIESTGAARRAHPGPGHSRRDYGFRGHSSRGANFVTQSEALFLHPVEHAVEGSLAGGGPTGQFRPDSTLRVRLPGVDFDTHEHWIAHTIADSGRWVETRHKSRAEDGVLVGVATGDHRVTGREPVAPCRSSSASGSGWSAAQGIPPIVDLQLVGQTEQVGAGSVRGDCPIWDPLPRRPAFADLGGRSINPDGKSASSWRDSSPQLMSRKHARTMIVGPFTKRNTSGGTRRGCRARSALGPARGKRSGGAGRPRPISNAHRGRVVDAARWRLALRL